MRIEQMSRIEHHENRIDHRIHGEAGNDDRPEILNS
jgi:hypothetical protein